MCAHAPGVSEQCSSHPLQGAGQQLLLEPGSKLSFLGLEWPGLSLHSLSWAPASTQVLLGLLFTCPCR